LLLNVIQDLLSSVLGPRSDVTAISSHSDESNTTENVPEEAPTTAAATTLQDEDSSSRTDSVETKLLESITELSEMSSTTLAFESEAPSSDSDVIERGTDEETAAAVADDVVNEIDLKIENLANAETSFMTEGTANVPESITEAVKLSYEEPEVLKVLEMSDDGSRPMAAFVDSISQVMNLVKGNEGRLALAAAADVIDTILIDRRVKDEGVYGSLTNLRMPEADDMQQQQFESDISNAAAGGINYDDIEQYFVPNNIKSAVHFKYNPVDIDF